MIAVVTFTDNARMIAKKISENLENQFNIYDKTKSELKDFVRSSFYSDDAIIFICASGIAIRLIAPYVSRKDKDPAVVLVDELGRYAISLLSGHLGGANELTQDVAKALGATPIITTATDLNNVFSVDTWAKENNCEIEDISKIKHISSAILRGERVAISSDFDVDGGLLDCLVWGETYDEFPDLIECEVKEDDNEKGSSHNENGIVISLDEKKKNSLNTINLIPKLITLGVGCRRGVSSVDFEEYILGVLKQNNISIRAVKDICSIELKKDEKCIVDFSEKYSIKFKTFCAKALNEVEGEFSSSAFVKSTTGVDNICERSAMCEGEKELLLKKQSNNGMTIALAKTKWRVKF